MTPFYWSLASWALGLLCVLPLLARWRQHAAVLRSSFMLLGSSLLLFLLGTLLARAEVLSVARVLSAISPLLAGFACIRLTGLALFREVLPRLGMRAARIVEDIVVVIGYVIWSLSQLRDAGLDPSSLVTTSAILTACVAFAMQDTLGNLLGGLMLEMGDAMQLGDWVRVGDTAGRVEQIRWRVTTIRTRDGERVVLPNSLLMRSSITVQGNPDLEAVRVRRTLNLKVSREVAPSRFIALTEELVSRITLPNVASDRAPNCVLKEIGQAHFSFDLRYWLIDPGEDDPTDSAVRVHLYAGLQRAGIAVVAPLQAIHATTDSPAKTRLAAASVLADREAALRELSIFSTLSEEELTTLAKRLVPAPFVAGEVMTRQGSAAHWLYLLRTGEAKVYIELEGGTRQQVASIGAGGFFGEMSLLTGAPRRATVIAATDVECFRLDKESFEGVLRARPALAAQLSHLLVEREAELARLTAASSGNKPLPQNTRETMMTRILTFFGVSDTAAAGEK